MTNALNLSRQAILLPPDVINQYTIEAYGVGSVGSHLVKILAKSGFKNIEVFDRDTVEEENIAAQAFDFEHIGQNKVDAMLDITKRCAGVEIITHHGQLTEETPITPEANTIYCCFFDSFEGRQMVFDMLKNYPVIFIDGRIGQYNMRHYLVELDDKKQVTEYNDSLNTRAVSDLICGEKACCPVNTQIAGKIVMNIINYIKGNDYDKVYVGNAEAPASDMHILNLRKTGGDQNDGSSTQV